MSLLDVAGRCKEIVWKLCINGDAFGGDSAAPRIVMPPVLKKSYGDLAMSVLGASFIQPTLSKRVEILENATGSILKGPFSFCWVRPTKSRGAGPRWLPQWRRRPSCQH